MRPFTATVSLSLSLLFLCGKATGSEEDAARAVLSSYLKAFNKGDWMAAAEYMHPDDLANMQKYIPPIFSEVAAKKTDKQSQLWAAAFFGDTPPEKRAAMTPKEAFVGLNRFMFSSKPELFALLKKAKVEVTKVEANGEDFIVHYTMEFAIDNVVADSERLSKKDGKWGIRAKLLLPEFSVKFRQAFGL